jgi:methionine biosynthesis protein MetW
LVQAVVMATTTTTIASTSRPDLALIADIVQPKSRVLDVGCGDGELLAWLAEHKTVDGRGVEIAGAAVRRAISRGVSAYQGDIDQGLADYPEATFDYVILSQTLQEVRQPLKVLREMLRIGERVIVSFPNFGHWTVRVAHLFTGKAPKTKLFPHEWHNSPSIHFLTIDDFRLMVEGEKWIVERAFYLAGERHLNVLPNLLAENALFVIRK